MSNEHNEHDETLLELAASGLLNQKQLKAITGKKLVTNSGLFGPTNPFDACTRQQFGYGIWTADNSKLYNWLSPALIPEARALNFYVMDWRNQLEQTPSVSSDWCPVPTYTAQPIKGCRIDYCFDPNMFYHTGRQTLTPEDLQNVCFQQPVFNLVGQQITNQEDYEQFMMFQRQMTISNRSLLLDDSDDAGEEDGLAAFFENFADRHPELTSTCLAELSPVTVDLTDVACQDIPNEIYNRVWEIMDQTKNLVGEPTIPENYFALVMNTYDAECVMRCQSCVNVCNSPIVISPELMTPAGRAVFYADYNNRLTGGAFGDGFIELRNGQKISIIRQKSLPRGTFYLLVKGWTGPQPNINAMRLAINNWSTWAGTQRLGDGVIINVLAGGGLLHIITSTGICKVDHLRWNWRLFSNAPWMQTQFTNLAACTEVVDPTFATLPDLVGDVPCDQVA